jgi:adenylate cyclase class 2
MQKEIEAKFLYIDHDDMRARLRKAGGVLEQPMRLMRRVVIDYKDHRMQGGDSWIRVRDEGDKVTLTYKTSVEHSFGGATEIEVEVSDYQKTVDIFEASGLEVTTRQETKRETWKLGEAEVVLDVWPWLEPFIEIEAPSEEIVKQTAELLGQKWKDAVFGSVTTAYRIQYPAITSDRNISALPEIKFNLPIPDWFGEKASR